MIAALLVGPSDTKELQKYEKPDIHTAERLARSGGWITPVAIRTTAGHSFTGQHKYKLCVNIDKDMMNMKLKKELSFKLAGGYHMTRIENLASIVTKGIMPGKKIKGVVTRRSLENMPHGTHSIQAQWHTLEVKPTSSSSCMCPYKDLKSTDPV